MSDIQDRQLDGDARAYRHRGQPEEREMYRPEVRDALGSARGVASDFTQGLVSPGEIEGRAFVPGSDSRFERWKRSLMERTRRGVEGEPGAEPGTPRAAVMEEMNMDAMRNLDSDLYSYKPGVADEYGGRVMSGPMAQTMEQHPITASVVNDTPGGKMVDTKAATMQQYGMLQALANRLDRVEGR